MKGALVIIGLGVAGVAGCEQILGTDNYELDGTSSSGAGAASGSNASSSSGDGSSGMTVSSSSVSSTSSIMGPDCYEPRDFELYESGHQIMGYQNRCSAAQLVELHACFDQGNFTDGCPLFGDPAAADCVSCIFDVDQVAVPVWLQPSGALLIWLQYHACIAVVQAKPHCIQAVELEYCRTSVCDQCAFEDKPIDYAECYDIADAGICGGVVASLPADCWTIFEQDEPECYAPGYTGRAKKITSVLCGPPP